MRASMSARMSYMGVSTRSCETMMAGVLVKYRALILTQVRPNMD